MSYRVHSTSAISTTDGVVPGVDRSSGVASSSDDSLSPMVSPRDTSEVLATHTHAVYSGNGGTVYASEHWTQPRTQYLSARGGTQAQQGGEQYQSALGGTQTQQGSHSQSQSTTAHTQATSTSAATPTRVGDALGQFWNNVGTQWGAAWDNSVQLLRGTNT